MKKYYEDMAIARGIGIFLVVLGHSFPDNKFNNNPFYTYIFKFIYSFHMPLFFIISGFFAYKIYNILNLAQYRKFIEGKINRLIIPYFAISLIAIPIKLYMNKYSARPIDINGLFIDVVLYPAGNGTVYHTGTPIQYFWFIYTLFLIFAVAPFLNKIPLKVVLALTLILNVMHLNITPVFYIWGVAHNLFYFYLGIYIHNIYEKYEAFKNKKLIMICTLILLVVLNLGTVPAKYYSLYNLATALTGSALFISISYLLVKTKLGETFKYIGNYSYDIYLFSWFFQTGARVVFFQMLKMDYTLVTIIMLITGLMPILLSNLFIKRIPILDRVLLGNTRI